MAKTVSTVFERPARQTGETALIPVRFGDRLKPGLMRGAEARRVRVAGASRGRMQGVATAKTGGWGRFPGWRHRVHVDLILLDRNLSQPKVLRRI